jgi:hypothetical protein
MMQGQPAVVYANTGLRVLAMHLRKNRYEFFSEFADAFVSVSELIPDGRPRNKLRLADRDTVKALCQPGINIEPHGRMRQDGYRAFL